MGLFSFLKKSSKPNQQNTNQDDMDDLDFDEMNDVWDENYWGWQINIK